MFRRLVRSFLGRAGALLVGVLLAGLSGLARGYNSPGLAKISFDLEGAAFQQTLAVSAVMFFMVFVIMGMASLGLTLAASLPIRYLYTVSKKSMTARIVIGLSAMFVQFWGSVTFANLDLSALIVGGFQANIPLGVINMIKNPLGLLSGVFALIGALLYLGMFAHPLYAAFASPVAVVGLVALILLAALQISLKQVGKADAKIQVEHFGMSIRPSMRVLTGCKSVAIFSLIGALVFGLAYAALVPSLGQVKVINFDSFCFQVVLLSVTFAGYQMFQQIATTIVSSQLVSTAQLMGIPAGYVYSQMLMGKAVSFSRHQVIGILIMVLAAALLTASSDQRVRESFKRLSDRMPEL